MRQTDGRLFGRPPNGVESRYLLVGLAECGGSSQEGTPCRGHLAVVSRRSGARRAFAYQCRYYHDRGKTVCTNSLAIPMDLANEDVLAEVRRRLLVEDYPGAYLPHCPRSRLRPCWLRPEELSLEHAEEGPGVNHAEGDATSHGLSHRQQVALELARAHGTVTRGDLAAAAGSPENLLGANFRRLGGFGCSASGKIVVLNTAYSEGTRYGLLRRLLQGPVRESRFKSTTSSGAASCTWPWCERSSPARHAAWSV